MSDDEAWLSPAAKKAARDSTRRRLRQRRGQISEALLADWEGNDPDCYNVLEAALGADGESRTTAWLLFGLASRAISELSEVTGVSEEEHLARLL